MQTLRRSNGHTCPIGICVSSGKTIASPPRFASVFATAQTRHGKGQAVMSRAKIKRFASTHYLLVGSAVAGECFLDKDGNIIVLRLAKGTSLSFP
jgi:hypothetical protein